MNEDMDQTQDTAEDTHREPSFRPDVDIVETDQAIIIHVDMPGVAEDGVEVRLEDDVLSLVGTISKDDYTDLTAVYTEYNVGNYRRRFSISSEVSGEKIEGKMSDGVLELVLPKVVSAQPRQIPITSA
jgi:HSP20 family molecular chaperone IbpA